MSTGPYLGNYGTPGGGELGVFCPHGVKIVECVSVIQDEAEFKVVEPWPCTEPGCTREDFNQVLAAVETEYMESMRTGYYTIHGE